MADEGCAGTVIQAPAPPRLIEGGIPTEAMVAHVPVARYADHLPLYRQAQMLARQGVIIERSTLSFWMGEAGPRFRLRSRWNGQMRVRGGRGCPGRGAAARDAAGLDTHLRR
jgi:transposase